ncbi:Response regulator rcp1 [Maioricimonas rarisocia]|uniref:Response regulator rcp1 n=1 Tax=Maioricimonas rarisocia TaxID=2528026 RepID=A0A517ZBS8_9PLAN|nr:response regulator [Maioricimonas rarisocia]QDU39889.1 Response regulator rcp1 [Maioricimonas rarisocia]
MNYLLIEDDDDHAQLTIRGLEREVGSGCISRIRDGESALKYFRDLVSDPHARFPSMILLDLKLPRISGLELLTAIKSDPTLRRIPVVVLTTSDAESDRLAAFERHANAYIVKPLEFADFRRMLRSVHDFWSQWNRSTDGS